MQNSLLTRLKQSLIEKEYAHQFAELLKPTIRLNREDKNYREIVPEQNQLLPSISNTKLSLTGRNKTHSAKKIPPRGDFDKNKNSKSSKRISHQLSNREQQKISNKPNFQDLIIKKQSIIENSANKLTIARTKLLSLRTPSREGERIKETTQTKDLTAGSHLKGGKGKSISIRQFNTNIQQLNEELHLCIRGGKVDSENFDNKKLLAYLSKLKSSNEEEYKKIQILMDKVLKFAQKHKIINGSIELKALAQLTEKKVLSNHQLLSTFTNKKQIEAQHKIVGLQYYTKPEQKGQNLAAHRITSLFKMIFSRRFYKNLSVLLKKVKVIQRYWRMSLLVRRTRRNILEKQQQKIRKHNQLQKQLSSQWNLIKTSQRAEIHICSYSLQEFKRMTSKHLKQKENNQITRIFKAQQTDVCIIYIVPFQLDEDIIKYYQSIFTFNTNNIQEKVYFIFPENRSKIEQYCSITTASALLYSPKALKRIRQLIVNQYAYIVPSFPSVEYVNLSAELNVPILGSNQSLAKLYSTKSGALQLLGNISRKQKAPFLVSKSILSVFSEKELINSLSILIYRQPETKIWYFKIEDQINSRGLAYLNINKIAFLRQICSGSSEFEGVQPTQMIKLIADELSSKLRFRLKIINKDIYANYDQYISHFLTRGGIIEAGVQGDKLLSFSISFFIEPSGEFSIVGTYNKLELGGKSINQAIRFPSSIEDIDYEGITRNLYKQLWQKNKLFGYFSADFVYSGSTKQIYGVGLDCFLNEKTSSLFMVNYCCSTHFDKDKNALINVKDKQVFFTYCPSITLLQMPSMPTFFKNCKFQNVSFDLEKRVGIIFVLIDQLESEQVGFLSIQESQGQLLRELKKLVDYFCKVYRPAKSSHDEIGLLKGSITTSLRQYQKQESKQIFSLQDKC